MVAGRHQAGSQGLAGAGAMALEGRGLAGAAVVQRVVRVARQAKEVAMGVEEPVAAVAPTVAGRDAAASAAVKAVASSVAATAAEEVGVRTHAQAHNPGSLAGGRWLDCTTACTVVAPMPAAAAAVREAVVAGLAAALGGHSRSRLHN